MNTLDAYLTAAGISNADFAAMIGSSESSISRLRRGRQSPSFDLLARIAAATDNRVTPNDFLSEARKADPAEPASPTPVVAA